MAEVFDMPKEQKDQMGKKAREWTLENYSVDVIGKKICDFIDGCDFTDEHVYSQGQNKNPKAEIDSSLTEDEWLISLYKNILDRRINEKDDGFLYWKSQLNKNVSRETIENYFRSEASKTNKPITDFLDDEGKDNRVIVVMPQTASDVFLITSLFSQIKSNYPECNLYVATQREYSEMLDGNPNVHKVIPYFPEMENVLWLEGSYKNEGYFKVAYLPYFYTQKSAVYQHGGKDVKDFETIL
jgi:ADP-heptose:LPS heptosyltransferase